jgi:uncharacterized protein
MASGEVDQRGSEVLSVQACLALLAEKSGGVGRLGFVAEDGLRVLPLNFAVLEGALFLRIGPGQMFESLRRNAQVAFEIDEVDGTSSPPMGWSVSLQGVAQVVDGPVEHTEAVSLGVAPLVQDPGEIYVRVEPIAISGRHFSVNALARWRVANPAAAGEI